MTVVEFEVEEVDTIGGGVEDVRAIACLLSYFYLLHNYLFGAEQFY